MNTDKTEQNMVVFYPRLSAFILAIVFGRALGDRTGFRRSRGRCGRHAPRRLLRVQIYLASIPSPETRKLRGRVRTLCRLGGKGGRPEPCERRRSPGSHAGQFNSDDYSDVAAQITLHFHRLKDRSSNQSGVSSEATPEA